MKKRNILYLVILTCVMTISCGDKESNSADEDLCPNNPNKTKPGNCGCSMPDIDSDTDGVLDCDDSCPYDTSKIVPGVCGCNVPDLDSDTDGVLDCDDSCPYDTNKSTPGICGCYVPDIDSDSDGIMDCVDTCVGSDGSSELCNGIDDDCDGATDESWPLLGQACELAAGECGGSGVWQCKSTFDDIKCSAIGSGVYDEICDGIDNNCDGETDETFPLLGNGCYNGVGECKNRGDLVCSIDGLSLTCDAVPGQPQDEANFPCDGIDHNCDGLPNNGIDQDGDGYEKCTGLVNEVYDCNDEPEVGVSIYPGNSDVTGDGIDNNCDGVDGMDDDGDGYASVASGGNDCNDDPSDDGLSFNPGVVETCNGEDNNCSGSESDAIEIGEDEHCTACFDNCIGLSLAHGSDSRCRTDGSECDFTCDNSYYDLDRTLSNGCEARDDRPGSKDNGTNTVFILSTQDDNPLSSCGDAQEYTDGRLPEDDNVHDPIQGDTADLFTFYYKGSLVCAEDFGLRYRTYCSPDGNDKVKFSIYSDENFTNEVGSVTVNGAASGIYIPSPNLADDRQYYIKVENIGSTAFQGKYAFGVYDEALFANWSEWIFTGWTDCSFD